MDTQPPGGPLGQRLLPVTIDEIARKTPDREWALLPSRDHGRDCYQSITYTVFANAINRMAWFIERNLGHAPSGQFPTVCYIGKSDMRYQIVEMAAPKTGYKVLFSSHINSLAAHLNLLEKTSCEILMSARGVEVSDILEKRPMKHLVIPELDDLIDPSPVEHYAFRKSYAEAKSDPFLILHTSGSTGLPKPVIYTHEVMAVLEAQSTVPPLSEAEVQQRGYQRQSWIDVIDGKFTCPFAPFHVIWCVCNMIGTVFGRSTHVFALRDSLPHTAEIMEAAKLCDILFLAPNALEEVAKSEAWLEQLSHIKQINYGGGALSPSTGSKLSELVRIRDVFGTTETGMFIFGVTAPEDWAYICFDPQYNGIDWRPSGTAADGEQFFEPVIVKDPKLQNYQATFKIFPEKTEYAMGDLWVKHPTKPDLWRYAGRVDDLICFANGLKFHPHALEDQFKAHPFVKAALLFAEGHLQTVLLVEPTLEAQDMLDRGEEQNVRDSLWDMVSKINVDLQSHVRIAKTHILFAAKDKPFARASKGTVMRFHTLKEYADELESCYEKYGDSSADMLGRVDASG